MSATIIGGTVANAEKLVAKLVDAFEQWTASDINQDYWTEQFTTPKWPYNKEGEEVTTKRRGPSPFIRDAGSPRDIYDYGDLYKSGKESYKFDASPDIAEANWRWDATNEKGDYYAYYVHEGLGTNAEPRKWTEELSVPAEFEASEIKKKLLAKIKAAMGTK